jgi:RNA polymerase sigma-70 factor (ECF subfamily)
MTTDEPLPTRASLLKRLRDSNDAQSWEEFHRIYCGLLTGVARRAGLNEHEADETVQEIMIAVSRKLPEFRYDPQKDSFKGWLLQIARWKISDQMRNRPQEPPAGSVANWGDDETRTGTKLLACANDLPSRAISDPARDFDAIWESEWQQHLLMRALASVKRRARPAQYAIYHLHVLEELPVESVCRVLGVNSAQVYLAKHRVGSLIKKELLRLSKASS